MSRSELICFFLKDFGVFQVIAGSYSFSSALFGSAHFGRSIVPVVSHQFWFHVFKGHAVKYHGINKLSHNVVLLIFLIGRSGVFMGSNQHCKGVQGEFENAFAPEQLCIVRVGIIFSDHVLMWFFGKPEKMAGLCAPSSNLVCCN